MKQSVIKEMSTADLKEKLAETKAKLTEQRLNHAVNPMENPWRSAKHVERLLRLGN